MTSRYDSPRGYRYRSLSFFLDLHLGCQKTKKRGGYLGKEENHTSQNKIQIPINNKTIVIWVQLFQE